MRIIRFVDDAGKQRLGTNLDNGTAELVSGDLFDEIEATGRRLPVRRLLAPIAPPNIYGIGLNYGEHARQMGAEIPQHPVLFMKPTTAIANPGDP